MGKRPGMTKVHVDQNKVQYTARLEIFAEACGWRRVSEVQTTSSVCRANKRGHIQLSRKRNASIGRQITYS
jgi:hypothetical protein